MSKIHDMSQLDSIYIICEENSKYKMLTQEWSRIKGIFKKIDQICDLLKQILRQLNRNSTTFRFVEPTEFLNENIDRLDQSFMYIQLFKEILLEIEYNEQSIKDLVTYCIEKYGNNDIQLNLIRNFEREYYLKLPISWYSSEVFLYTELNRSLCM